MTAVAADRRRVGGVWPRHAPSMRRACAEHAHACTRKHAMLMTHTRRVAVPRDGSRMPSRAGALALAKRDRQHHRRRRASRRRMGLPLCASLGQGDPCEYSVSITLPQPRLVRHARQHDTPCCTGLRWASLRSQRRLSRHWSHTIRDKAPYNIARDTSPRGNPRRAGYHAAGNAGDLDAAGWAYPSADTSADGCADQRVGIQGAGPPRETVAGCHAACAKRHE
jgi:hypothetical protein